MPVFVQAGWHAGMVRRTVVSPRACRALGAVASWRLLLFEPGEDRSDSGAGPRVVRVGTHALRQGSTSTLSGRLRQHRGVTSSSGGNHRGSVFRQHVGRCLAVRHPELAVATWGVGASAPAEIRAREHALEQVVSQTIGAMSVVAVPIDDDPGPASLRGYVERNAIALLSNLGRPALDAPSPAWLGRGSASAEIRGSGVWNVNHVRETHAPEFVERFAEIVSSVRSR
jgi:hypothetical protein